MRYSRTVYVLCVLTAVGFAGLNGTYTIKPDGSGDFLTLWDAGEALVDSGMSGNCVFEIYGDTLSGSFSAWNVAGSDSWMTTFRPGPEASPVILGNEFNGGIDNVKLESLRFFRTWITIEGCSGWRISGCRFTTHDWGVKLDNSTYDTVDANTFDITPTGGGHYPCIVVEGGSDNVIFNNVMNSDSDGVEALVQLDWARNTRFVFNTLRQPPVEVEDASCIKIRYEAPCEVRNNVFVLARPADSSTACVSIASSVLDSIVLDNNCYFVESLGYVGARPFYPDVYDWDEWRGFGLEANGINADPMLVSATDLHLRLGSPCIGAGVPIAGIELDIDGDPRDPAHPDIGADEFTGGAVEESYKPQATGSKPAATVVRGLPPGAVAFDAMGRRVVSAKPGVYFVRSASGVMREASSVYKVIIQR